MKYAFFLMFLLFLPIMSIGQEDMSIGQEDEMSIGQGEISATNTATTTDFEFSQEKQGFGEEEFGLLGFTDCEDYTTYTEVDPNSDISITATKITLDGVIRNSASYVYKDYGVDYFNEINITFESYLGSAGQYGESGMGFSNTIGNVNDWESKDVWFDLEDRGDGSYWIWLGRGNYVAFDYWAGASKETIYYMLMTRSAGGDDFNLKIYSSDEDRTNNENVLDILVVSGFSGEKWRYVYGQQVEGSYNSSAFTGYIENLCFSEGSTTSDYTGHFDMALLYFFGIIITAMSFFIVYFRK